MTRYGFSIDSGSSYAWKENTVLVSKNNNFAEYYRVSQKFVPLIFQVIFGQK